MGISVNCSSCSNEFSVKSTAAGKRVECPVCGERVRVSADADEQPTPRRRSAGESRKRGTNSKAQSPLLIGIVAGGVGVAVIAVLFAVLKPGTPPVLPAGSATAVAGTQPSTPVVTPVTSVATGNQQQPTGMAHQPVHGAQHMTVPTNSASQAHGMAQTTLQRPIGPPGIGGPNPPVLNLVEASGKSADPISDTDPLPELSMTKLVAVVERSVVRIIAKGDEGAGVGSGFVIDADGSIMTNYHVIEGARSAVVEFESGEKVPVAGFTTLDTKRDLAIIKIEYDTSKLHKIRIATELPLKGEKVAAFGAPRGLSFTASDGIISAIRRSPEFKVREAGTYLQTTSPISPGNSGGPLVNMRGEVVGVNSFKIEGENLNFAVSADDIRDVIKNRGATLTKLSPEALPSKYSDKFGQAENLAGTTRGKILLSQINDAAIVMLPFAFDPRRKLTDFVESQVEKTFIKRIGWTKVTRQSQFKGSSAIVLVLIYYQVAENIEKADEKMVSELMCRIRIIARDIDKEGDAYTAIVMDENGSLGTIAPQALLNGTIPQGMRAKIPEFFGKVVSTCKKAVRESESAK